MVIAFFSAVDSVNQISAIFKSTFFAPDKKTNTATKCARETKLIFMTYNNTTSQTSGCYHMFQRASTTKNFRCVKFY